jgi:hypothetical protein
MKKFLIIIALIAWIQMTGEVRLVPGQDDIMHRGRDEVLIGPNAVVMPLGRIALVRKGSDYCAVKFTAAWTGKTEEDRYATYESCYQGDGTGDFSNKNVQLGKGTLVLRRHVGPGRGFPAGCTNFNVKCGAIKLLWGGKGSLHHYGSHQKDGDYGIELAPTKWTDISQVNVFDKRLKWYRYDEKRKDTYIPIDQLWENGEDKK